MPSESQTQDTAEREHSKAQRKMLKWVQWAAPAQGLGCRCPSCGDERPTHKDACELAALLAVDFDKIPRNSLT